MKFIKQYTKNPLLILVFVTMYIIIFLFSKINLGFQSPSPTIDYIMVILPSVILLLIYSLFFSVAIGSCSKGSLKKRLSNIKYFFGNFILLIPIILINILSFYLGIKIVNLTSPLAAAIIQAAIFLLLTNFLLLSFFFHTLNKQNILKAWKNSIIYSFKNYFWILIIPVSYFLITILISLIPISIIRDLINILVIYPLVTLALNEIFEDVSTKR